MTPQRNPTCPGSRPSKFRPILIYCRNWLLQPWFSFYRLTRYQSKPAFKISIRVCYIQSWELLIGKSPENVKFPYTVSSFFKKIIIKTFFSILCRKYFFLVSYSFDIRYIIHPKYKKMYHRINFKTIARRYPPIVLCSLYIISSFFKNLRIPPIKSHDFTKVDQCLISFHDYNNYFDLKHRQIFT